MSKPAVISVASQAPDQNLAARSRDDGRLPVVWLSFIFLLAAALRLWFNFATTHANSAFSCDAAEYLRNAQTLLTLGKNPQSFWTEAGACLLGAASPETVAQVRDAFRNFGDFFISGPIFPLYLIFCYLVTGTACDINNWGAPIVVQSLLTALSCVLVALIGCRCWDNKTGLAAGVIAAIYPAFILNSGRLYCESFACFLLCLTIWLTVRGTTSNGSSPAALFLTGATMIALQLTRSIMFVFSIALFPITYFQNRTRRPWLALALLTAGCAVVALPWLSMQQLVFGKGGLVVDRVGHYNFFTGNNVDAQGWLSYPYPDMTGIEQKSFLRLAKESFKRSPSRWLKLVLDKPARLFKFPWNDFRAPIGPLTEYGQVFIHQIVLLAGGLGMLLCFAAQPRFAPAGSQVLARSLVLGLLLFQCVYMAFITVPRYNLTAMPLVILFSAAGVVGIARLLKDSFKKRNGNQSAALLVPAAFLFVSTQKLDLVPILLTVGFQRADLALVATSLLKAATLLALSYAICRLIADLSGNHRIAKISTVLLTLAVLPSVCLPLRAHGRWWEWQCRLTLPGQKVTQQIYLPLEKLPELRNRQCYLMINSDGAAALNNGIAVRVNGTPVEAVLIPNLPFLQDITQFKRQGGKSLYLECEYIFECLTYAAGISNLDLRQWFLIPIPPAVLQNQVAGKPLAVEIEKTDRCESTLFGAYSLDGSFKEIPHPALYSWEKAFYGVENDLGFTDSSLDARLPVERSLARNNDLSPAPGLQTGDYYIRLLVAPPVSAQQSPFLIPLERRRILESGPAGSRQPLASLTVSSLPQYARSDQWLVRITGTARSPQAPVAASIRIAFHSKDANGNRYSYDCPWAPRRISSSGNQADFNLAFPLSPAALPGQLKDIEITFQPPGWSSQFKNTAGSSTQSVQFQNVLLEIDQMPSLPMSSGHYLL